MTGKMIKGHEFLPAGITLEKCVHCKLTRRHIAGRGVRKKYEYLVKTLDEYKRHPTRAPDCPRIVKTSKLFGPWFKAQFGVLPNQQRHAELKAAVRERSVQLATAESKLYAEEALAEAYRTALLGWQAGRTPGRRLRAAIKPQRR